MAGRGGAKGERGARRARETCTHMAAASGPTCSVAGACLVHACVDISAGDYAICSTVRRRPDLIMRPMGFLNFRLGRSLDQDLKGRHAQLHSSEVMQFCLQRTINVIQVLKRAARLLGLRALRNLLGQLQPLPRTVQFQFGASFPCAQPPCTQLITPRRAAARPGQHEIAFKPTTPGARRNSPVARREIDAEPWLRPPPASAGRWTS